MKLFEPLEIAEARDHAAAGGQALHRHLFLSANAPRCFVRDVRAGKHIGHLFDQDIDRLRATAKRLGVRVVVIERAGTPVQHVDLCGKPMERALATCCQPEQMEFDTEGRSRWTEVRDHAG